MKLSRKEKAKILQVYNSYWQGYLSGDVAGMSILINNAFYAVNSKSEVSLSAGRVGSNDYKPTVTVTTRKIGDKIEITVKDNGAGIPDDIKDKIFQPFFTTKPTGSGTGLGLSMSFDIITKGHGGELQVNTEEGAGTEFIIILPY